MKLPLAWAALATLAVAGCGATIRSQTSPNVDLAAYHTFSFYTPPYREGAPASITDQTIQSALRRDLAAKGLTESPGGQPDFLVTYHVQTRQKVDVSPSAGYGYYGYYGAPYVREYTEGTLVVDFIDPRTRNVIWRGTATDIVNHPNSPDLHKLDNVVGEIVKKYPVTYAATPRPRM